MKKVSKPPSTEYERKFLVLLNKLPDPLPTPKKFAQGYLRTEPLQERIRFVDDAEAYFQFKGASKFESKALPIPVEEARYLLENYSLEGSSLVEKNWYGIPATFDGLLWEIHWFLGDNDGLVVAELEYPTEDYVIPVDQIPEWVGPEITGERRFKNKVLTMHPFKSWPETERQEILKIMRS